VNHAIVAQFDLPAADDIPGWDSLNLMFVVMEIEARFRVPLSAEEIAALPDIGCCAISSQPGGR